MADHNADDRPLNPSVSPLQMSSTLFASLSVSQEYLVEAVLGERTPEANGALEQLAGILGNPHGTLSVVASRTEVESGNIQGWEALVVLLELSGSAAKMMGRLNLEVEGYEDDGRQLFQIPEVAVWLKTLQAKLPWLAAWLTSEREVWFQLVGAQAPWDMRLGTPDLEAEQLQATVRVASYATAFSVKLGAPEHAAAERFLRPLGLHRIPADFYEHARTLAASLDGAGRLQ